MHILIIGGTRFIGPCVARQLTAQGHRVTVFHRGQTEDHFPSIVSHIHGDRRHLSAFKEEFARLALHVVLDMIAYTETDALAVKDTFRGLARRVVTLSSGDVYRDLDRLRRIQPGPPCSIPLSEAAPLRETLYPYRSMATGPDDMKYTYDKIPVERAVMGDPELPGTILRLPAVYGPGDYQHRLFDYLKRMDDGRPAILLEEGAARWRWTRGYIENVAAAIALAVTDERAAGRIYNVGEEEALSEAEWVQATGRAAGWNGAVMAVPKEMLPKHLTSDYDWQHHLVYDTSRLRAELGYAEHIAREDALKRTVAWERAHPPEKVDDSRFDYGAEDAALARLQ